MWRVEGGEGQFAGASGLITSNFLVEKSGELIDHHVGVLFIPETGDAPEGRAFSALAPQEG